MESKAGHSSEGKKRQRHREDLQEMKRRQNTPRGWSKLDSARLHRPSGSILGVSPPLRLRVVPPHCPPSHSHSLGLGLCLCLCLCLSCYCLILAGIHQSSTNFNSSPLLDRISRWTRVSVSGCPSSKPGSCLIIWPGSSPIASADPSQPILSIDLFLCLPLFSLMATHPFSLPLFISLCALRLPQIRGYS